MLRSRDLVGVPCACCLAALSAAAQTSFTEEAALRGVSYVVTAGVDETGFGSGLAFCDLDGDGDADLVTSGADDGHLGFFENDGNGYFTDRSEQSGAPPIPTAAGITAADYDADGDLDVYVSVWLRPNLLLRNMGSFRFMDVAPQAGVADLGVGTGAAWADYDGDGWLDLYVANRTQSSNDLTPNRLYRNLGDGSFVELAASLGVDSGVEMSFQAVFGDIDEDGDPDLFLSNDKGSNGEWTNRLWRNDGGVFSEMASELNVAAAINSMGVAFGDFNGDLLPDLYCTNTQEGNVLHLSHGPTGFLEMGLTTAEWDVASNYVGWSAAFVDLDNNGWRELFVANMGDPNRVYQHTGSPPAVDVASRWGLADAGTSFCASWADIDLDGDLDLALQNANSPIQIFVNQTLSGGPSTAWVRLTAAGPAPNRSSIGARVEVSAGGLQQSAQVLAGSGYKSQDELPLHFGLGSARGLASIGVHWPDGRSRVLHNYALNSSWTLWHPSLLGDANGDGVIDLQDVVASADCVSGPAGLEPGCEILDYDGDADVDSNDLAQLWLAAGLVHLRGLEPQD